MRRRAFTIVELLVILGIVAVIAAISMPMFGQCHCGNRTMRDATQVRQLHQAFAYGAQGGPDQYLLPSRCDKNNDTMDAPAKSKDTTANILSMLVFNGSISTEILISPLETNPNVVLREDYEFDEPRGAANPAKAVWDPKLSAELDGSIKGNVSYAHLQPSGLRLNRFTNTAVATEMLLGTRGPEIASVKQNSDGSVTRKLANPKSNTLSFFGKKKTWSGNMAYNDGHVQFLTDWLIPGKAPSPSRGTTYAATDGKPRPDLWCYDEPDDPKSANDYLGIFIKAGDTPADFKAAWD